jgi:hypothetical protein
VQHPGDRRRSTTDHGSVGERPDHSDVHGKGGFASPLALNDIFLISFKYILSI